MTAAEIVTLVGGELIGDEDSDVQGVASLESAGPQALSFVASARYLPYLHSTRASVVLISKELASAVPDGCTAVVVPDPHQALYTVLSRMYPPPRPTPGIHSTAVVDASADLADDVSVGPYVVVGPRTCVGTGSVIKSHAVIGAGCRIGSGTLIHPHVTLYDGVVLGDRVIVHSGARVGREGFGYVWRDGGHRKVPQVGGCIIGDDVEVGANVTIDRGSVGDTIVGAGTKIDNLVHLGHNAHVGRNVILVSQVGISGSTTIGDGAMLGGQAGIAGHLEIGAGSRIGAQAGVISNVPAGETYSGYPARPHREALRAQAALFRFSELFKRLRQLEEAVFGKNR